MPPARLQAAFTCSHVFRRERPVLYVVHDTDGCWQLLCGAPGHTDDEGHLVGLGEIVDRDASLNEILDLPRGGEAERAGRGSAWRRAPHVAQ